MRKFAFVLVLVFLASGTVLAQEDVSFTVHSQYVPMRDGVQIATYTMLPADLPEGEKIPAILRSSRYMIAIQNLDMESLIMWNDLSFLEAGYAVVLVSARGTGASGGTRPIEWSPDEIADMGEIVEWIIQQPWSNGRVGGYGVSYDGNTAELLMVPNHPAVKAVAPLFSDFDPLAQLAMPGGIFNDGFIEMWNASNQMMDTYDICMLAGTTTEAECNMIKSLYPGPRWMDDDPEGVVANQHLAEHESIDVFEAIYGMTYRDDTFGASGYTLEEVSPYGLRSQIETANTPAYYWVSWLDAATSEGALARYRTFDSPQQLIIGAWNHGGEIDTDPFRYAEADPAPSYAEQFEMRLEFFDRYLREEGDVTPPANSITYYTLNTGTWTTTDVFPPEGFETQRWYFGAENTLSTDAPTDSAASDDYVVNFDATTGENNRWTAQLGTDVIYGDRAEADALLLTYTSAPFETDVEITGHPVISLQVASTHEDGAFYAYLEDVAPDGTVTYITEGQLRAIHRAVATDSIYQIGGVLHSLNRADALPLVPGETTEVTFNLYATSVLIHEGHSIRVAIAGHDASMFERYPAEGTPTLTIERNSVHASYIDLPMQAR